MIETLGVCIFLGCALIGLVLIAFKERKANQRFWDWRERLIESINHNSECIENVVNVLINEK